MSNQASASAVKENHPERRLTIGGAITNRQPFVTVKLVDQETGQHADVQVEVRITYRLAGLHRGPEQSAKPYTLLLCLNNHHRVDYPIVIPALADRITEHVYDVNLDLPLTAAEPKPADSAAAPTAAKAAPPQPPAEEKGSAKRQKATASGKKAKATNEKTLKDG